MLRLKLWERYFFREILKSTLFCLLIFFGLYVLIDYASHTAAMRRNQVQFQWLETFYYYLCEFSRRLDVLLPFALLISTIRTLTMFNVNNEFVALMSSGISLQKLLRPFVYLGLGATLLVYLNAEFLLPKAMRELHHIEANRSYKKKPQKDSVAVQHLTLKDGSTLLYKHYDPKLQQFVDVYWIRMMGDLYRLKSLLPFTDKFPVGHFVDHLTRNARGTLVLVESFPVMEFTEMRFNRKELFESVVTTEDLALSELKAKIKFQGEVLSDKEAQTIAEFYHKLITPWICLLAVMAPMSFCVCRTRTLSVFFIYAGSLFALVTFHVILSAALLLGKRQTLAPALALWPPFLLATGWVTYCYKRVK